MISWGRSLITVRVPSMAPGTHKVYVTVGGRASNSYPFSISAATVVTGRTFSTASQMGNVIGVNSGDGSNLAAYTHDVLFENCTFEATNPSILGDSAGVLTLGQTANNHNLTFRNCTFKRNSGAGSGRRGRASTASRRSTAFTTSPSTAVRSRSLALQHRGVVER